METLLEHPAAIHRPHWLGEPVNEFTGSVDAIAAHLPDFQRVPFGVNPRLDMIVRPAAAAGQIPVPAAVVSKSYVLVQHLDVVSALLDAMEAADIDPASLNCRLRLTEGGTRMALRAELPPELAFTPPDGHPLALTFECYNSVDCSVPLFAVLGWFRFVCSNGLVVGTTHARVRQRHRSPLDIEEFEPVLAQGLEAAKADCDAMTGLVKTPVTPSALRSWVDGPVARTWGPFAAARVHSIVTTGLDGEPSRTPKLAPPHARDIVNPIRVPGANAPARDAYAVAQALAWVAARRKELAEETAWRAQIAGLMGELIEA